MKIHWLSFTLGVAIPLLAALATRPSPTTPVAAEPTSTSSPTALGNNHSLPLAEAQRIIAESESHWDLYKAFADKDLSNDSLTELVSESITQQRGSALPMLHLLAEKDPEAALEQAIKIHDLDDDSLGRLGAVAMAAWAKFDPDAALDWLEANSPSVSDREIATASMRGAIVTSLARKDPDQAISRIHKMLETDTIFSTPTLPLPDESWPALLSHADAHRLIPLWLEHSPDSCLAWYRALPASEQSDYRQYLTPHLILTSPDPMIEATRIWAATENRGWSTASPIAKGLHGIDPTLAGEWIGTITGEVRSGQLDILYANYAADIASFDPSTAFAWILAMEHDGFREPAAEELFTTWSRYQPLTAESEFLAAGWSADWIAERRRELSLRETNNDLR